MSSLNNIREVVYKNLETRFKTAGISSHSEVGDSYDLVEAGIIDSLGFVNLMLALELHLGISIDFLTLPTDQVSKFGALCLFLQKQSNVVAGAD